MSVCCWFIETLAYVTLSQIDILCNYGSDWVKEEFRPMPISDCKPGHGVERLCVETML